MTEDKQSFAQALEVATIIPDFFQSALKIHQTITGKAQIFQKRRDWLERYLQKTDHPFQHEKMKVFKELIEDYIQNPSVDNQLPKILHYEERSEIDFFRELEKSIVIPSQCDDEIFLLEKLRWHKRPPLKIEEEKMYLEKFFAPHRYIGHPLSIARIQAFAQIVIKMRSSHCIQIKDLMKFDELVTTVWLKSSYYLMDEEIAEGFAKVDKEIRSNYSETIDQFID